MLDGLWKIIYTWVTQRDFQEYVISKYRTIKMERMKP